MADGPTLPEAAQAVFQGPLCWAQEFSDILQPPAVSGCRVSANTPRAHCAGQERHPRQITLTYRRAGMGAGPPHMPDSHAQVHRMSG